MGKASRKKVQRRDSVAPHEAMSLSPGAWWAQPWTILIVLPLLTLLSYSNTFSVPFQFDDIDFIVNNPQIKHPSTLPLSGSRYVTYLSFALNYQLGRLQVFGYHVVNLLIHLTNGFLVYALVRGLVRTPRIIQAAPFNANRSHWIAFIAALLFVAHPIQTMAVTYIYQRLASLAALLYLLAVVCYLNWRLAPEANRSRLLWYAGAFLSTLLAMKTKENTFTLPFMLLLIEAVFFGFSSRKPWKPWMALIPFFLTLPIIPLSSFPWAMNEGAHAFARETTTVNRLDYLFTQFSVILTYLRLLLLPIPQNLDYDYPVSHSLLEPKVFFSFLFLSALLGLALYLLFTSQRSTRASQYRLIGFGLLWFFLTLSIESSIIPISEIIDEYRLYLPSVGLLLAGSVVMSGFLKQWGGTTAIVIGVLAAMLSVATYQRNEIWKSEASLWSDVVRKSPNKERGHYNLALAYANAGQWDEALALSKTAVALFPNYAETHNMLGNVYRNLGRPDEAIQEYNAALLLTPDYAVAHNNLGVVYLSQTRLSEALAEFEKAVGIKSDYPDAHNNLGLAYQKQKRFNDAIREFNTALQLNPDSAEAHANLGNIYSDQERRNEAIREYQKALTLKPDFAGAHYNLGLVYKKLGRLEEAVREFQISLTLKPDLVEAHYSLGQTYQRMGRTQEAIHAFEKAVQIKPDYELARQALSSLRK